MEQDVYSDSGTDASRQEHQHYHAKCLECEPEDTLAIVASYNTGIIASADSGMISAGKI